eukprot:4772933-Prymnesium_polylepis.1
MSAPARTSRCPRATGRRASRATAVPCTTDEAAASAGRRSASGPARTADRRPAGRRPRREGRVCRHDRAQSGEPQPTGERPALAEAASCPRGAGHQCGARCGFGRAHGARVRSAAGPYRGTSHESGDRRAAEAETAGPPAARPRRADGDAPPCWTQNWTRFRECLRHGMRVLRARGVAGGCA